LFLFAFLFSFVGSSVDLPFEELDIHKIHESWD
jgi:hypothetical protein